MNREARRLTAFVLLLGTAGPMLGGCGSGGKTLSATTSAAVTRAANGTMVLNLAWPVKKSDSSRAIPVATSSLVLVVTSQTGVFTDTRTNTKTVSVAYGTPTITVTGVPAGGCLIQGFALLQNADKTQVVLATLNSPLQASIVAGQNNAVTLTLSATLTATTTSITTAIQKVLNPDGSAVSASDPMAQPRALSPTTPLPNLTDGAVYNVFAALSNASGVVPLPASSEFTFTPVNNTNYAKPFLTAVDAKGATLATSAVGNSVYFKINASGSNGSVVVTLNSAFTDPSLTPVSAAYPLAATVPLLARLMGRGAFQVKDAGEMYYHLIENNFAGGNLTPRVLVPPFSASGAKGQLYNTQNPTYEPTTGRWLAVSAIQQVGATPDPNLNDSYGIILIDTKAAVTNPVNLTASLPQFAHARCQDPHWSADGKKIIFQTNTNAGTYTLHVIDVDLTQATPTAVEDPNSPTFLSGADPLLLSDGSIVYVDKATPNRLKRYTSVGGSVFLNLPNDTNGAAFTSSYYANVLGTGLVFTVNHGDGTPDQLATYDLSANQPTLLEPSVNTATNNSDPIDAGNGLLLFSRTTSGYHLFVALPGSTLTPQEIDFTNVPATSIIVGAAYTP